MALKSLSSVDYAALLVYSPKGESEESAHSRDICYAIKNGRLSILSSVMKYLKECVAAGEFPSFFGPDVTLVPTPRSFLLKPDALWPAKLICEEIVSCGLGAETLPCLKRHTAVQSSASSRRGMRTDVQRHMETMGVEGSLQAPSPITIVDDVITKGRTLYAAASLVKEAFPNAEVRAFALIRTMGLVPEIENIRNPCVGRITRYGSDVDRQP